MGSGSEAAAASLDDDTLRTLLTTALVHPHGLSPVVRQAGDNAVVVGHSLTSNSNVHEWWQGLGRTPVQTFPAGTHK
jgi:hypothetical protein